MDEKIKKNYIFNVSNQILSILIPFITAPYVARVLGADGIGQYSYCESIVSYFVLFACFGLPLYGQREVSYHQKDILSRSKVFWETQIIGSVSTALALLAFSLFLLRNGNKSLLCVLALNILSCLFDISWFFQGMENFRTIAVRNLVFRILNVGFVFLFVKDKGDLILYALGICGFSALNYMSLWLSLPKYITHVPLKELSPFRRLPQVASLFVPTIAIQVYTVLDKTMIGAITKDAFQNGYYEQAIKISKLVLTLVTSLGSVMMSRIGLYFSNKKDAELRNAIFESYRFVWFLSIPLAFGLSSASSNFIPWFYGSGFEGTIPLLQILSFLIVAIGVSNVTGVQYMIPVGKQRQYTISVVVGACMNLVLNALLIPRFLALGAAVASLIAEVSVTATQLFLIRKDLNTWKIIGSCWKYLVSSLLMFLLVSAEGRLLSPSILHTSVMVLSGVAAYFLVLLLLRDDTIRKLVSKESNDV